MRNPLGVGDRVLFGFTILLTVLGLLSVADTSAPLAVSTFGDPLFFVKQQLIWAILGFGALIVAYLTPYTLWKKFAPHIFAATLLCLVIVLLPGVGSKFLGARRWIILGPVGFQPSEFIKLALALFFAWLADRGAPIKHFVWTIAGVSALVMLQPDLGTTITIVFVGFVQMLVAGMPLLTLGVVGVTGAASALVLILTSDYRRARLLSFFSREADPHGSSYHVRQILIALGSGGLFGVGLGQSKQKHLFLPESATDSVFAIIAEELGFVGAACLILLLAYFALRALKIASSAPDTFSRVLATGISAWVGGQMFLNIASMVALTPLTGIPLPFFSYGGSSLTMILLSVGILLQISRHGTQKASSISPSHGRARRHHGTRHN